MSTQLFKKSDLRFYRTYIFTLLPWLGTALLALFLWFFSADVWSLPARIAMVAVVLLLGLGATAFLAAQQLRSLMRPLAVLARAMQRLGAGERHIRVQEVSNGEMGALERGFNAMSQRILTVNERMQADVAQATRDLEETLEALEIRNAELDIARKRALAANEVKSNFLTNMSHEIRTPMNGIVGFADLLANTELNSLQSEYLGTISRSAGSLLTIIDDILDYAALESGELVLAKDPFSLRKSIDQALQLVVQQAHGKHLELVSLVYDDVPDRLIGDPARVVQILGNLLSNAVKFTDQGEVVLRVMLEECSGDRVTLGISVSDTGTGIPISDQEQLFEAFQRGSVSNQREFGGTGLGLSLCHTLATAMDGGIEVSSRSGAGSTFRVTLSLVLDSQPPAAHSVGSLGGRAKLHEPHGLSRVALRNALSTCGLHIEECEEAPDPTDLDGKSLLMLAGGTSGNELDQLQTRIARANRARQTVVAIVGSCDPEVLQSLRDTGAALVLSKPLIWGDVCERLAEVWQPETDPTTSASGESQDSGGVAEPTAEYLPDIDPSRPLRDLRVLAADDNPINLQLLRCYLENLGAEVIEAANGEQAVNVCNSEHVDLAVLDVHMPVMNGLDAAQAIRKLPGFGNLPLVALTADVAEQNNRDALRAGFDLRLTKPVTEEELRDHLLTVLRSERVEFANDASSTEAPEPGDATLPIRDPEQALRIAGGSESIAQKLLLALLQELPSNLQVIQRAYEQKDWKALWDEAHRLHGSAAVCAVPALHDALGQLQSAVKMRETEQLPDLLAQLHMQAQRLLHTEQP